MIILRETTDVQTLSFIPRQGNIDTIVLTNETTGVKTTIRTADRVYNLIDRISDDSGTFEAKSCLLSTLGMTDVYIYFSTYYSNIDLVLDLKENNFYTIDFYGNTNLLYKDKIFCTNQDIVTFSVNNNQYESNTTTNEFIVYE